MNWTLNLAKGHNKKVNLSHFNSFIGQESVIKKVSFFAKSSSVRIPFPTLLLTGSHGLGKTYLSKKIADSLGRKFIVVNCGAIKTKEDFMKEVMLRISSPSTILFDESHTLSKEITTLLLTILNPGGKNENNFTYEGNTFIFDFKYINVIFATTDAHMMFKPLKNRCHQVYFSPYSNEELVNVLKFYLGDIELKCNLEEVADACRSRARDAFLLSQNIKRFKNIAALKDEVSESDWANIKSIFDISPKGLRREELNLLKAIKNLGPISCANLAKRLMVNENNIEKEIEVRLRELGFVKSTSKGREITSQGKNYLQKLSTTV
jgi:Holliday junction DNA helicase RuvB